MLKNRDGAGVLTGEGLGCIREIDVHIVKGQGPMASVGEPGLPSIAPAVANALLWGYGIEVNQLPMTPEYVKTL